MGALVKVGDLKTLKDLLQNPETQLAIQATSSKYMTPEKVVKIATLATSRQPDLFNCTPKSVLNSIVQAAELGLNFGGGTGEGYLIPYGAKYLPKGVKECQFMPGYQGFIELAYRTGKVEFMDAHVVYTGDEVEYSLGSEPFIKHKPTMDTEKRGRPLFTYCVIILKESKYPKIELMSEDDITKVRNKSRAKDDGPWVSFPFEMRRKSVLRRAWKYIPKTPEVEAAMIVDNTHYSFDQESGKADAAIKETMGSETTPAPDTRKQQKKTAKKTKKIESKVTDTPAFVCGSCGKSPEGKPEQSKTQWQCPKCLKWTDLPSSNAPDESFMED